MTTTTERDPRIAALIEQQLGIPGKYGAWWTARRLLQSAWKQRPYTIRDCTFDLRDLPFTQATGDLLWRRPLSPGMIGRWVQYLDKNSQYLSACRSVKTGKGDPLHLKAGDIELLSGMPGIFRVTWNPAHSRFDGKLYPLIIDKGDEWINLDVLHFAVSEGYDLQVHEAWVFPAHGRVLEKWAERLWEARVTLKKMGEDEAAAIINDIAHVGPGAFATNKQTHPGLDLIHPNWWADVVGKARVNILANLNSYGPPVCIRTDGLYFVTRGPDPHNIVSVKDQKSILERESESGGYKIPKGFTPFVLTQEMYDQAEGLDHAGLASLFKKCGGMQ